MPQHRPDRYHQQDEPFLEGRLAEQLRETAGSFAPASVNDLVAGGVTDGRKRRRRRSLAVAGGSATLALIAVGGVLSATLSGPAALGRPDPAGSVHGSPVASPVATPSAAPGESDPARAAAMLFSLERSLPAGASFGSPIGRWGQKDAYGTGLVQVQPSADVVYDDHHGAALVEVDLAAVSSDISPPSCPAQDSPAGFPCTVRTLPGGARLMIEQGSRMVPQGRGMTMWSALLFEPDNRVVEAREWNSPTETGKPTRSLPPLDTTQLRDLVTNPLWGSLLAALPARKQAPQSPSSEAILRTIGKLLPHGVTGQQKSGQDGYAQEQLVDGSGGVGLIGVNVQYWDLSDASDAQAMGQVFAGATVLSDGSKLVLQQQPAEKGGSGAVEWVVDVLRPNGQRVVAMEFNAPAQGVAADRTNPVLTMDQLKALVTSPLWSGIG